jgi:hypothetical protein
MDPRRIELNRKHSREMGALFSRFLDEQMTEEQDVAWTQFSAELLARHQAERSALADEIEAEQQRS